MTDPLAGLVGLPGVAKAADDARTAVDRLLDHRVLRRRAGEVAAESALRAAHASALLDGAEVSLEELRSGTAPGPVVQGALRTSAELGGLVETWRRAPRQVLARLHVLAAADVTGEDEIGRPRYGDDVVDPLGLGAPPPPAVVTARLDALADLLVARTDAPAGVVAAVVHGEVLAVRPFRSGNGLVARAAARLTIMARGLDPKGLGCTEAGHLELGAEYAQAALGYANGGPDGVAAWIRHCGAAVRLGARESLAVCEALLRG